MRSVQLIISKDFPVVSWMMMVMLTTALTYACCLSWQHTDIAGNIWILRVELVFLDFLAVVFDVALARATITGKGLYHSEDANGDD